MSRRSTVAAHPNAVKKKWTEIFYSNILQCEEYYLSQLRPTFTLVTDSISSSSQHRSNVDEITLSSSGDSKYFPMDIKRFIKEKTQAFTNCRIQLPGTAAVSAMTINLQFYHPFDLEMAESPEVQQKMESYVKNVMCWILFVRPYARQLCVKTLTLTVFLTKLKKELPEKEGLMLSAEHVNTGFTDVCDGSSHADEGNERNRIIIYRKEEWFKVFIHETFHRFGLDFSYGTRTAAGAETSLDNCLDTVFRFVAPHKYHAYEAYCEFWARWIHTLFCALWSLERKGGRRLLARQASSGTSNSKRLFIDTVNVLLEKEQKHSCAQMIRVLRYVSGIDYTDLFLEFDEASNNNNNNNNNNNVVNTALKKYREDTNVMSYYVLACILFCNCAQFLRWCAYERGTTNGIAFREAADNYASYCEFFRQESENPEFLRMVQQQQSSMERSMERNTGLRRTMSSSNSQELNSSLKMTTN